MRELVGTNAVREHKFDGNKLHVKTVFNDDKSLDTNENIRRSGMLDKAKLGLHENEDVRMVISIPSTLQYALWKKKFPDMYEMIKSLDESVRMKGIFQLKLIHPDWVVFERL